MSLADQIRSDAADVLLNTDDHAEELYLINARGQDAESFTGIFDILDPMESTEHGKEVIYSAEVYVADSLLIKPQDKILARGLEWIVKEVGASDYGLRKVKCTTKTTQHNKPKGAM